MNEGLKKGISVASSAAMLFSAFSGITFSVSAASTTTYYIGSASGAETYDTYSASDDANGTWTQSVSGSEATAVTAVTNSTSTGTGVWNDADVFGEDDNVFLSQCREGGSGSYTSTYTLNSAVDNGIILFETDVLTSSSYAYDGGTLTFKDSSGAAVVTVTIPGKSSRIYLAGNGGNEYNNQFVYDGRTYPNTFHIRLEIDLDDKTASMVITLGGTKYDATTVDINDTDIASLTLQSTARSKSTQRLALDDTIFSSTGAAAASKVESAKGEVNVTDIDYGIGGTDGTTPSSSWSISEDKKTVALGNDSEAGVHYTGLDSYDEYGNDFTSVNINISVPNVSVDNDKSKTYYYMIYKDQNLTNAMIDANPRYAVVEEDWETSRSIDNVDDLRSYLNIREMWKQVTSEEWDIDNEYKALVEATEDNPSTAWLTNDACLGYIQAVVTADSKGNKTVTYTPVTKKDGAAVTGTIVANAAVGTQTEVNFATGDYLQSTTSPSLLIYSGNANAVLGQIKEQAASTEMSVDVSNWVSDVATNDNSSNEREYTFEPYTEAYVPTDDGDVVYIGRIDVDEIDKITMTYLGGEDGKTAQNGAATIRYFALDGMIKDTAGFNKFLHDTYHIEDTTSGVKGEFENHKFTEIAEADVVIDNDTETVKEVTADVTGTTDSDGNELSGNKYIYALVMTAVGPDETVDVDDVDPTDNENGSKDTSNDSYTTVTDEVIVTPQLGQVSYTLTSTHRPKAMLASYLLMNTEIKDVEDFDDLVAEADGVTARDNYISYISNIMEQLKSLQQEDISNDSYIDGNGYDNREDDGDPVVDENGLKVTLSDGTVIYDHPENVFTDLYSAKWSKLNNQYVGLKVVQELYDLYDEVTSMKADGYDPLNYSSIRTQIRNISMDYSSLSNEGKSYVDRQVTAKSYLVGYEASLDAFYEEALDAVPELLADIYDLSTNKPIVDNFTYLEYSYDIEYYIYFMTEQEDYYGESNNVTSYIDGYHYYDDDGNRSDYEKYIVNLLADIYLNRPYSEFKEFLENCDVALDEDTFAMVKHGDEYGTNGIYVADCIDWEKTGQNLKAAAKDLSAYVTEDNDDVKTKYNEMYEAFKAAYENARNNGGTAAQKEVVDASADGTGYYNGVYYGDLLKYTEAIDNSAYQQELYDLIGIDETYGASSNDSDKNAFSKVQLYKGIYNMFDAANIGVTFYETAKEMYDLLNSTQGISTETYNTLIKKYEELCIARDAYDAVKDTSGVPGLLADLGYGVDSDAAEPNKYNIYLDGVYSYDVVNNAQLWLDNAALKMTREFRTGVLLEADSIKTGLRSGVVKDTQAAVAKLTYLRDQYNTLISTMTDGEAYLKNLMANLYGLSAGYDFDAILSELEAIQAEQLEGAADALRDALIDNYAQVEEWISETSYRDIIFDDFYLNIKEANESLTTIKNLNDYYNALLGSYSTSDNKNTSGEISYETADWAQYNSSDKVEPVEGVDGNATKTVYYVKDGSGDYTLTLGDGSTISYNDYKNLVNNYNSLTKTINVYVGLNGTQKEADANTSLHEADMELIATINEFLDIIDDGVGTTITVDSSGNVTTTGANDSKVYDGVATVLDDYKIGEANTQELLDAIADTIVNYHDNATDILTAIEAYINPDGAGNYTGKIADALKKHDEAVAKYGNAYVSIGGHTVTDYVNGDPVNGEYALDQKQYNGAYYLYDDEIAWTNRILPVIETSIDARRGYDAAQIALLINDIPDWSTMDETNFHDWDASIINAYETYQKSTQSTKNKLQSEYPDEYEKLMGAEGAWTKYSAVNEEVKNTIAEYQQKAQEFADQLVGISDLYEQLKAAETWEEYEAIGAPELYEQYAAIRELIDTNADDYTYLGHNYLNDVLSTDDYDSELVISKELIDDWEEAIDFLERIEKISSALADPNTAIIDRMEVTSDGTYKKTGYTIYLGEDENGDPIDVHETYYTLKQDVADVTWYVLEGGRHNGPASDLGQPCSYAKDSVLEALEDLEKVIDDYNTAIYYYANPIYKMPTLTYYNYTKYWNDAEDSDGNYGNYDSNELDVYSMYTKKFDESSENPVYSGDTAFNAEVRQLIDKRFIDETTKLSNDYDALKNDLPYAKEFNNYLDTDTAPNGLSLLPNSTTGEYDQDALKSLYDYYVNTIVKEHADAIPFITDTNKKKYNILMTYYSSSELDDFVDVVKNVNYGSYEDPNCEEDGGTYETEYAAALEAYKALSSSAKDQIDDPTTADEKEAAYAYDFLMNRMPTMHEDFVAGRDASVNAKKLVEIANAWATSKTITTSNYEEALEDYQAAEEALKTLEVYPTYYVYKVTPNSSMQEYILATTSEQKQPFYPYFEDDDDLIEYYEDYAYTSPSTFTLKSATKRNAEEAAKADALNRAIGAMPSAAEISAMTDPEELLEVGEEIAAAKKVYEALDQTYGKNLVERYEKLLAMETAYNNNDVVKAAQEEAEDVVAAIDNMPDVVSANADKINDIADDYNALSELAKSMVTNYSELETALAKLSAIGEANGDVDGDGKIGGLSDITKMVLHIVHKQDLSDAEAKRADLNGDGEVDVLDLVALLRL